MTNPPPSPILVIGYGNNLRSDDGVGVRVAQVLDEWSLPDVRSLPVRQLTPELAAEIAAAQQVIFVDAYPALPRENLQVFRLSFSSSKMMSSHASNPWALLALTCTAYNRCPTAWWVLIPGTNFELGDRLSPTARRGMAQALKQIVYLIQGREQPTQNLAATKPSA
ncbi:MAG: hydrogenase maturation protease [Cyanophyceae cyanobacterium]